MTGVTNAFPVCKKEIESAIAEAEQKRMNADPEQGLIDRTIQSCDDIGYRISTIGIYAFGGCTSLSTASFPACTTISRSAFYGCSNLASLYLMNSEVVALASSDAFSLTPMSRSTYLGVFGSVYVPLNLYDSYISSSVWSIYSERIVGI